VENVRRYEGPVLAEREYVAEQARGTRVGRDVGAPTLGDLVTDRLAARGVDLASLAWDAARDTSGPWTVFARFSVADETREARWTFDASRRTVVADEDEARWLSETEIADEPVSRRHLAAVRDVVFDFQADGSMLPGDAVGPAAPEPDPVDETHTLLDDLRARRGTRQALELEDDDDTDEFEGFGPQHAFDFQRLESSVPGAHPVDADHEAEAVVLPVAAEPSVVAPPVVAAPADEDAHPDRPRSARRGRAKVPSWDEIVFGAKPE
jgi:hypothetical protein